MGLKCTRRALWDREGGECWPVRPRMIYVPRMVPRVRVDEMRGRGVISSTPRTPTSHNNKGRQTLSDERANGARWSDQKKGVTNPENGDF